MTSSGKSDRLTQTDCLQLIFEFWWLGDSLRCKYWWQRLGQMRPRRPGVDCSAGRRRCAAILGQPSNQLQLIPEHFPIFGSHAMHEPFKWSDLSITEKPLVDQLWRLKELASNRTWMSCAEDYLGAGGERGVSKKSSTKYNQPTNNSWTLQILHFALLPHIYKLLKWADLLSTARPLFGLLTNSHSFSPIVACYL